jgi:hypothetical protein
LIDLSKHCQHCLRPANDFIDSPSLLVLQRFSTPNFIAYLIILFHQLLHGQILAHFRTPQFDLFSQQRAFFSQLLKMLLFSHLPLTSYHSTEKVSFIHPASNRQ